MLVASDAYKSQINQGNRNYLVRILLELADEENTELVLENENLWAHSVSFTDAVSDENAFNIGSAIIGQCSFVIDNIDDSYSEYDFYNAKVTLFFGLEVSEGEVEYVRKGYYTVDSADYNGSLISITCLNNMWTFDVPYSEVNTVYPASCGTIVRDIVIHCLGSATYLETQNFPNSQFVITERPKDEMNCREVLQYISQICCCFCRINSSGQLGLKWYDTSSHGNNYDGGTFSTRTTPYSDGDEVEGGQYYYDENGNYVWTETLDYDGGSFIEGDIAYITECSQIKVGMDAIIVTGVKVYKVGDGEDAYSTMYGLNGYVLGITDNPFITKSNCQSVAEMIGSSVVGMEIRTFDAQCLDNVLYEASDFCEVNDFRGNRYESFITNLTFTIGNYEHFSCGAETPQQRLQIKYSNELKTLVEAQRRAAEQISEYDVAVQRMNMLASNMMGVYFGNAIDESGGTIAYSSNKPFTYDEDGNAIACTLGAAVWKRNAEGYFICSSANSTDLTQLLFVSGIDNDGDITARVISTIGLSADWINAGQIKSPLMETNVIRAINNGNGTINDGKLNIQSATIFGKINGQGGSTTTIDGGKITTGSIKANQLSANSITSAKIAANAITSEKINVNQLSAISSNLGSITGGSLNINNRFKVDTSGNMTCSSNASVTGKIYSSEGSIGGFAIKSDSIGTGDAIFKKDRFGCGTAGLGMINLVGQNQERNGYIQLSTSGTWADCRNGIRIYGDGRVVRYGEQGEVLWDRWLFNIPTE